MGICQYIKSIQEIIHSKYTLARDSASKNKNNNYYHVYIWKYTADDLSQKDVMFYESQNGYFWQRLQRDSKKLADNRQKQQNQYNFQNQKQSCSFLIGQSLQWPFKAHADEGYIILTIRNNRKYLQRLTLSIQSGNNQGNQNNCKLKQFRHRKVSVQMLQIIYMIHLDSFKPYYFTEIKQQKQNPEYQASIQIITGDLLDKIDCLKLVSISHELQKYLKAGQQNILKKFYNQHEYIAYLQADELSQDIQLMNLNNPKQKAIDNLISQELLQKSSQCRQIYICNQLQIQRVFANQIKRINNSQNFQTQQERQAQINKLVWNLCLTLQKFHILNLNLMDNFPIQLTSVVPNYIQSSKVKNSKSFFSKQSTKLIVQKYLRNGCQKQSQKIFLAQQIQVRNIAKKSDSNKLPKPYGLSDFSSAELQEQDISVIHKPKDQGKISQRKKNQELDTSSPFMCQITQIGGLQGQFQQNTNNQHKNSNKGQDKGNNFPKNKSQHILNRNGQIQESLFLPRQLQQLRIDRNLYKVDLKQSSALPECPIVLAGYAGSSQHKQLQRNNVSFVVNLSPSQCYNYFVNDINYQWYQIQPIHKLLNEEQIFKKELQSCNQYNLYIYNIECLLYGIIDRINVQLQSSVNQDEESNVCIFCNHKNMIYSGTIAVAYLMFNNKFRQFFPN